MLLVTLQLLDFPKGSFIFSSRGCELRPPKRSLPFVSFVLCQPLFQSPGTKYVSPGNTSHLSDSFLWAAALFFRCCFFLFCVLDEGRNGSGIE